MRKFLLFILLIVSLAVSPSASKAAVSGLNFNGQNNYINPKLAFDNSKPFTVQAELKLNQINTANNMHIVSNLDARKGFAISYRTSDNRLTFVSYNGDSATQSANSSNNIQANKWYRVTGVYNGTDLKLYIDGVLQQTEVLSGVSQKGIPPVFFGARPIGTGTSYTEPFKGELGEVKLWNKALTQAEVTNNNNTTNLVGYWVLDGLTTSTVYDQSINNNHGQAFNFLSNLGLSASNLTDMAIGMSWGNFTNANYELIQNGRTIYSGPNAQYTHQNLISDTLYSYTLKGKSANGESIPITKTFATKPGELSILQVPSALNFNAITLNGLEQKSYGSFNQKIIVKDTRKNRNGWKLVVKATPLKSTNSMRTFPTNKISLKPVSSITQTSGLVATKPTITNSTQFIDEEKKKLVSAGTNTGYGVYEITLPSQALELTLSPANTYVNSNGSALSYFTDLTWTIEEGA
ncbi:LamG-like jellyroll fold domain-containing protein [Robertmurraya kyonggiensis]|uniref:LamG-like jellyroll fold domain-containing protein n=1 Tax=Robertmurraya kyonggiensis TaxID=1037680 RepID=A0A4U1D0J3_9BACI|nr:LamG-like jellyroll fold domain-containing protein [Robertmurraya kyonggiensis]TKC15173.1 hypothetical protein FA727_20035 [Robertmurraya kyonggiensis]